MFQHILLPTDGTDFSLKAVDVGVALAARLGARIYAFHVIEPYFETILQLSEDSYNEEMVAHARDCLDQVCRRAEAAGVRSESCFVFNDHPYRAIVATTAEQGCDLIVMASHGRRGLDGLLMGSETHKVILQGSVPVLVCHP
jgi:nucleotide-binding universal stress UspA family protein